MLYTLAVTQGSAMLNNLKALLLKAKANADARKFDVNVLAQSRLAPDMFPLTRQVQIACDSLKLGVARVVDQLETVPKHADTETTIDELIVRIEQTLAYLGSVTPAMFADAASRRVGTPRWDGKTLSGEEFIVQYALPNLYFHITTSYAILRHNGVDVGKQDYLGPLPLQAQ